MEILWNRKSRCSICFGSFSHLFYIFFIHFFGPLIGDAGDRRPQRRNDWSGNNRWPGSGGPGGPPRGGHGYGTGRRPIGRPTFPSGMSCPPLGGGS
ncbi:hypothetical protein, variant [Loa loa]|uniref:Uncharacterized protein n=2 Tax=Loa loa TaxID=7209 RepID=A0A1S0UCR2_LOALO|nr:hypothetical protein, variant [Loa loa]EJD73470.1 hypothetical protein, variant [Loa loa]